MRGGGTGGNRPIAYRALQTKIKDLGEILVPYGSDAACVRAAADLLGKPPATVKKWHLGLVEPKGSTLPATISVADAAIERLLSGALDRKNRTELEGDDVLDYIAELDRLGYVISGVAADLGISVYTVSATGARTDYGTDVEAVLNAGADVDDLRVDAVTITRMYFGRGRLLNDEPVAVALGTVTNPEGVRCLLRRYAHEAGARIDIEAHVPGWRTSPDKIWSETLIVQSVDAGGDD